jgi:tetratricopeptide (TPR) repeat protein
VKGDSLLGSVDGKHYTEYVEVVKVLKSENKLDEAEKLLLRLVEATEEEAKLQEWGVAPWYYEQLAIVYRKQKNYPKEVSILERFAKQKPPKHWGIQDISQLTVVHPLLKRLEKAKILAGKEFNHV